MFCPNCGKKINDTDNFCKYCGKDLRENAGEIESIENPVIDKEQKEEQPPTSEVCDNSINSDNCLLVDECVPQTKAIEEIDEIPENYEEEEEEIVVYEIKKHFMSMFWPCVFSPIFIAYFWKFYVIIPTFWGFVVALLFLVPIVHPVLRYFSDRIVITTSNLYITRGVFVAEEIRIPLKKIHLVRVKRSFLGKLAGYGHLIVERENSNEEITYRYIQDPDDVQFILNNPAAYIKEYLK